MRRQCLRGLQGNSAIHGQREWYPVLRFGGGSLRKTIGRGNDFIQKRIRLIFRFLGGLGDNFGDNFRS